jgi:hypothetical protein
MGGPASRYATASIAVRFAWPNKHHHYTKVGVSSGGTKRYG